MNAFKLIATILLCACFTASAQDVVLTGHVQRIILQPYGTEDCPPPCAAVETVLPSGLTRVCVSNGGGGCEAMEVKVDHVYRGEAGGRTRQFRSHIGEWGPRFPVTGAQIVVSEDAGQVFWSPATRRGGRIFIDPKRLRKVGGVPTSPAGEGELVALDEVLARANAAR